MLLDKKICLVTGASRGIGRAIAELFLNEGAIVIGTSIREDQLANLKHKNFEGIISNASNYDDSRNLFQSIFKKYSKLDVLVNNAGKLTDERIGMISKKTIDEIIDTNLKSVLINTQNASRLMKDGGSIINISSIVGRLGNEGQMVYSASKSGIIGATFSAAKELGKKNIRVNAIAPGIIDTDMIKSIPDKIISDYEKKIPLQRLGRVNDIANLVLFLACEKSTYITNQIIGVDGGWSL